MNLKSTPFTVASLLSVASVTPIHAAPLYWKTDTAPAAAWDSATWATAPGGSYDQPWVTGSDVVFEDNFGTPLTIAGPAADTNFASITANENVTLTPGGILGTGTSTGVAVAIVDVADGKTLDFAGQAFSNVVGTGFIKNGPGTWSLANAASYTGGFTLNAGTVAIGNANALGNGGSLTLNGGTLRSTNTGAHNLTGKFAGGILVEGDVTLGDATATGLLTFSDNTYLGAATRTLIVNSNVTLNGTISGAALVGLTKAGPGILTLSVTNTYPGATTVSEGILNITNIGALPGFGENNRYSVANGAALTVANAVSDANIATMLGTTNFAEGSSIGFDTFSGNRTYDVALGDTAQGSLGLVKIGANNLTLSGNNSYSGGTIVRGGGTAGITVGHANALGTGPVVANGYQQFDSTLLVNDGLTVANPLTLKRGLSGTGRVILGLGGGSTWSGDITVDNSGATGFAVIAARATATATASVVSGNIGYSTLGTPGAANPTFALRQTNGFGKVTGSVSLSNGYIQILDSSKWEFSNASNTWGTLDINHSGAIITVDAANTLSPGGVVFSNVGGTLQLNNQAATTAHDQTISGLSGNVRVGLAAGVTEGLPATLTLDTSEDQSSSGVISGNVNLVKSGPAKQTLTGINTYTGSTTIDGGTLALGATGELPVSDLTISSATLDLRKGTATRAQYVNDLTLSNATLEIGLNAEPDQIDALEATVSGTNTLKLHGSVPTGSYSLITTQSPLNDSNFLLDTSGVTASGFPTSYSGGVEGTSYVLNVTGAATPYTAYWRGDVNSVWNESSAAPNSNWATNSSGTTDAGQIPGAISDVFFSTTNANNTDTTLGGDISINSLIFESGTASVGGANTLTLLNTFNGLEVRPGADATLDTGSIVCAGASVVEEGGILTVNGGGLGAGPLVVDGTLNLNMDVTKELLDGLATGTISRGIGGTSVLTVSGTTNSTFHGAINDAEGTMALAKGGSSTLTLTGNSSYSGGTTITGGILQANASTALGSGPVAIDGGVRLALGDGVTVTNPITIGANTSPQGGGLLTATSAVTTSATLEGPITINNAAAGGGHFLNAGTGTFDVKSIITSSVQVVHRSGTITYWNGGTGYTAMNVTGTARLAADNGLATTATLTLGQSGASTFDLAGHNQTLVGIVKHASGSATIGNSSTTVDSVLTTTGTSTFDGVITNAVAGGTRTTGLAVASGALTLGGINTYTGNTTIGTGASLNLADNAQLRFAIGVGSNSITGTGDAFINGDFNIDTTVSDAAPITSGTWTLENVTSSYGDSFQVISGTTAWTATGNVWTKSVGSKNYSFDEATGVLTLSSSGGGGFDSWAASKGLTGPDAAFDADPDNDGLDNGLEFVLGGEPNPATPGSNSAALLPTVSQSAGNLTFTFKRKDISEAGVSLKFQWSTDLTFPSPANDVPVGPVDSTTDTITVDITEDSPDAATDTVVITIPAAKAAGGKLFGRLNAVKVP